MMQPAMQDEDQPSALLSPARPPVWTSPVRSLRHRDFRLFWIGAIVSVIGTWMQMVAQGWLVLQLTNSAFYLGVVGACGSLPMLLFTLPAGALADRCSKRNIVLLTQSLAMLQAFLLAGLIYAGLVRVWHVMLLAAFLGTVNAFDMPTRQAMVLELVDREDALNAVSLNSSAFNSGRIVGPAVAGLLIAAAGIAGCFFINGLSFLAIIIALALVKPRPPTASAPGRMLSQIGDGITWAKGSSAALWLLVLTGISSVFAMPYGTLMPLMARNVFGTGPQGYGFLMSASGAGALTSALLLTATGDRWRLGALTTIGSLFFPIALISLGLAPNYTSAIFALYFTGVGLMLFNAASNTMLQTSAPDSLRGRVLSLRVFVFSGFTPVGNLQIGGIAQHFGSRAALMTGGAVCLVAALAALWRGHVVGRHPAAARS